MINQFQQFVWNLLIESNESCFELLNASIVIHFQFVHQLSMTWWSDGGFINVHVLNSTFFEVFSKNQFHHPRLLYIWLHCYMWLRYHSISSLSCSVFKMFPYVSLSVRRILFLSLKCRFCSYWFLFSKSDSSSELFAHYFLTE